MSDTFVYRFGVHGPESGHAIAFNYAIDGLGDRMTAFRERKHGRNSIGDNVNLDCIKLNNMKLKHGFGPILG